MKHATTFATRADKHAFMIATLNPLTVNVAFVAAVVVVPGESPPATLNSFTIKKQ